MFTGHDNVPGKPSEIILKEVKEVSIVTERSTAV
jgi:hypothetical protein